MVILDAINAGIFIVLLVFGIRSSALISSSNLKRVFFLSVTDRYNLDHESGDHFEKPEISSLDCLFDTSEHYVMNEMIRNIFLFPPFILSNVSEVSEEDNKHEEIIEVDYFNFHIDLSSVNQALADKSKLEATLDNGKKILLSQAALEMLAKTDENKETTRFEFDWDEFNEIATPIDESIIEDTQSISGTLSELQIKDKFRYDREMATYFNENTRKMLYDQTYLPKEIFPIYIEFHRIKWIQALGNTAFVVIVSILLSYIMERLSFIIYIFNKKIYLNILNIIETNNLKIFIKSYKISFLFSMTIYTIWKSFKWLHFQWRLMRHQNFLSSFKTYLQNN